ncbi:MAG: PAS domain S-box protein, partial [Candidatus Cloacimonetes bacterium]|nr:PAS domain S-box protein [Candidatus Cloacimonadota bacterium]
TRIKLKDKQLLQATVRDITKRKRIEEELNKHHQKLEELVDERTKALKESEAKYRNIFEEFQDLYYKTDSRGILLDISPSVKKLSGYEKEELIGKSVYKIFKNPLERTNFMKILKKTGNIEDYELTLLGKDEREITASATSHLIFDKNKKTIGIEGVLRDLTERKLAEEKIQQQNSFLNKVMDSLSHPFYVIDANNYNIIMANSAAGFNLSSNKKTCYYLTHNSDKPCKNIEHPCPLEIVKKTKKSTIVEHIHFDENGNARNVEVHGYPILDNYNNVIQMIEYCLDITERKKAENELRNSEERLHILFESAPDAYYLSDLKGTFIDGNKAAEDLMGYKKEELIGKSFLQLKLLSPRALPKASKLLLKNIQGKGTGPDEFILNRKDGSQVSVEIRTYPVKIKEKTVVLGIAHDITERKKAEEMLRDNEQRMSLHFNQIPLGVIEWDLNFKVKRWNPAAEKIFGYSKKEAAGKQAKFIVPQSDRKHVDRVWSELLANKGGTRSTNENINRDGEIIICDWYNTPLINDQGKVIAVASTVENITERMKMDEALRESEKLSSAVIEDSPLGISVRDKYGTLILNNESWKKIWGFTDEQVESYKIKRTHLQMNEKDGYLGEHQAQIRKIYENGGSYYIPEIKLKPGAKNKAEWIMQRFYAILSENKKVEKVVILTTDISDRKKAEIKQNTLYNISNALITIDNLHELFIKIREYLGKILDTSNFFIALYDKETDMISLPYNVDIKDVHETFSAAKTITNYVIKTGKPSFANRQLLDELTKQGEIKSIGTPSLSWLGVPLKIGNKVIGVIAVQSYDNPDLYTKDDMEILTFVSEEIALAINKKQTEEQIKVNLEEKNTLLRELYHRTKNNMQVISAMLRMQSRSIENKSLSGSSNTEIVHESFDEMINKIKAMSLVHQKLYQSQDLSHINLKEYIADLVKLLMISFGIHSERKSLKLELNDVFVLIDTAIPLGLVLNELISNVFKHAFLNNEKDEISIRLFKEEDETINIHLSDNGIGIPKDIKLENVNTMGLQTVFSLIKYQLKGEVTYKMKDGLKWIIKLKDDLHKERV